MRLVYRKASRDTTRNHRQVWIRARAALGMRSAAEDLYDREFLFLEGGREFWIPVYKQTAIWLERELEDGDLVDAYVFYAGGVKENGAFRPVFLAMEVEFVKEALGVLAVEGEPHWKEYLEAWA